MSKISLFDLDREKEVMTRTAIAERKYRNLIRALKEEHQRYSAYLKHDIKTLENTIEKKYAEIEELEKVIIELRSTEPLNTITKLKQRINSLSNRVSSAEYKASTARIEADRARSAVYWESRKDFWDRL